MTRISQRFKDLKSRGQKAFIPYLTAGDPDLKTTEELLPALDDAGADIIELGVPFSDPMADGPVIQRASERALLNPIGVAELLPMLERVRMRSTVPIVLFTYFNPLLQFQNGDRAKTLKAAGVDGVLVTDLIPEEAEPHISEMRKAGIDTIFLVAPTSTDRRIELISRHSSGFVYVVARTGVTGVRDRISEQVRNLVARVRRTTDLPIVVGFGISRPEHVREVSTYADGVVVGSRIVLEVEESLGGPDIVERVSRLTRDLARPTKDS
jgi:tryptophan synthase alpha chain